MIKYIKFLLGALILPGIFNSCHNPDLMPAPEPEWAPVPVVKWVSEEKSFYNLADIENAEFEFILYGEDFGFREAEVSEIDVNLSINGTNRKFFRTFDSLPAVINLSASEAASEFGLSVSELKAGDRFTFSFVVKSKDGREFNRYSNNICGLIRLTGNCSVDAFVLNPSIVETSVNGQNNNFSKSKIGGSGEDFYVFNLSKRDFISANYNSIDIDLSYKVAGGTSSAFKTIRSLPTSEIPGEVTISASEAAALFDKTIFSLSPGDSFIVKFTFSNGSSSFSNYGASNCGVNFPSSILHPFHKGLIGTLPDFGFINREFEATAPPATSTSGTCSLTILVTN